MGDVARRRYADFGEFWSDYLDEHSKNGTRVLHFVGTSVAIICVVTGLLRASPALVLVGPLVGYAFAWLGHFLVEKNRPMSFRYPAYSLLADLKLWLLMLAGPERVDRRETGREEFPAGESPLAHRGGEQK